VDEVADELRAGGGQQRVGVGWWDLDVGAVEAVGEVEEDAVGGRRGEERGVGGGRRERGHHRRHLQHGRAVLPRHALLRVHRM
jgi:hypothetical protein